MVNKIHHVGVAVNDVEEVAGLFRDLFGCRVEEVKEFGGMKAAFVFAGDTEVELLGDQRPDTPIGKFLQSRGEGIHHLSFEVDDIEATLQELKAKGVELIDEKSRIGVHGVPIAFINPNSTNGVLIELCQKS